MSYAFQAEGLVKRFGKTTALSGVDLAARPGTVLGVLGPNGAGKTTAVRILATLLRPDGGRAEVHGLDVVREAAKVRELIGLTGQYASVDEDLTAAENLVLIARLLGLRKAEARARAAEMLERFGLAEDAGRRVSGYSGGMRRRLDLAASMIGRPAVICLDEPTTGLDPGRREEAWRLIRSMTRDGGTVLLTTQYLEEADALADEIAVIDRGTVIATGTPAALKGIAGGQTITVRPRDPGRVGEAAAILRAVSGREVDPPRRDVVTVPVMGDGGTAFAEAVRRLEAAGIAVAELSLRLPSLDEVFRTLTGHGTREEPGAREGRAA
ncbi:ATP-binding cassette domain-containing protein [Spirillospora sp. NPDC049024]